MIELRKFEKIRLFKNILAFLFYLLADILKFIFCREVNDLNNMDKVLFMASS